MCMGLLLLLEIRAVGEVSLPLYPCQPAADGRCSMCLTTYIITESDGVEVSEHP